MKFKIIVSLFICTLTFISCASLEDGPFVGFKLTINNLTNVEYDNAKILIGGMQNGEFVSTESFELPTIIVRPNESYSQVVAFDENRWKPNFNLITEISEFAYFAVQFEDGSIAVATNGLGSDILKYDILENGNVKSFYGVYLSISILDNYATRGFLAIDF